MNGGRERSMQTSEGRAIQAEERVGIKSLQRDKLGVFKQEAQCS